MQRTSWMNRSSKRVAVILAAGMALGLAGTAPAALFFDDFSSDTTANYAHLNTGGSGGSFSINTTTQKLTLTAGARVSGVGNNSTITHNDARLEPGEHLIMVVTDWTRHDFGVFVSSQAAHPWYTGLDSAGGDGIRFQFQANDWRVWGRTTGDAIEPAGFISTANPVGSPSAGPVSMYIFRETSTQYRFGVDVGNGLQILQFDDGGTPFDTFTHPETGGDMWIGAEIWGGDNGASFTIDSFEIVPEPGSLALLGAGLGLILLRRRRTA